MSFEVHGSILHDTASNAPRYHTDVVLFCARWDLAQGCGDDGEGFGDGCGGGDGDGDECYEDAMAVMPVLSAGLSGDYGARV
jgi:hypothetical protein